MQVQCPSTHLGTLAGQRAEQFSDCRQLLLCSHLESFFSDSLRLPSVLFSLSATFTLLLYVAPLCVTLYREVGRGGGGGGGGSKWDAQIYSTGVGYHYWPHVYCYRVTNSRV